MSKSIWMLSAGLFALATPAAAQDTDTDDSAAETTQGATAEAGAVDDAADSEEPRDSGDIIVTATRRNEALSDVPLAVSAVTAETLENSGITDIRQLTQVSPSLMVSSTSSEAGAGVARIRGIGTVGENPGLESSVALFIDGVYRSRTATGLTELGQIDRVEVLRGPQGTLFGRNASAGIISVITAKPRFEQEGNAQLTYGNYDYLRGEIGLTGPITENIAYRIDGIYTKRDGFLNDVISGRDVNDRDRYLIRGQMLFRPTDALEVRLIGDYTNRNEECCGATILPARDRTLVAGTVTENPSNIAALERGLGAIVNDDPFARNISITPGRTYRQDVEDYGFSGEVVYDFGGAELTSITAYRYNKFIRGQDIDFGNLDILFRDDDGSANQSFKTFTQELRLQGEAFGGRLDFLVGGYFANEELKVVDNFAYGADFERFANCLLFSSVLPSAVQPTPTGNCVNSTVLGGTIGQLTAGIAATQAGIAALSAIPPASRTPAQVAQLAALQAQLASLSSSRATLGALNANPARPGFGSLAAAVGLPTFTFNGVGLRDRYEQTSRNFALFTHNIVKVTDTVNLTLGLRYTTERKTLDATLTDNNVLCRTISASPLAGFGTLPCVIPSVPGGALSLENGRRKESEFSGTAVISWKPDPSVLTYLSYSRGYKAGGFNLDRSALPRQLTPPTALAPVAGPVLGTATLDDLEFEPETVDALELGVKYNGPGIDVNFSAFNQLFDKFQLNTFNGVNFEVENIASCDDFLLGQDTDNSRFTGACAGKLKAGVRSRGVEIEAFARPIRDVGLNLGASIIDTKYRRNLVGGDGGPLSPALFQLPERRISNSSFYTFTGSANWSPLIGSSGIRGLVYVDGRYQSKFNTGSDLDLEKIQDGFFVMNARIGLRGPDNLWGIELWGQNILDKDYLQVAFDAPVQGSGTIRGLRSGFTARTTQLFGAFLAEPRTYGVTVRTRF